MSAAGKPDDGGFSLVSEPAAKTAAPAAANDDGGFTLVSEPKPPSSWGDVVVKGVENIPAGLKSTLGRAEQAFGESFGKTDAEDVARYNAANPGANEKPLSILPQRGTEGAALAKSAEQDLQENAPQVDPGSFKDLTYQTIVGVPQLVAAVGATMVTKNPELGAELIAGAAGAQRYGQSRETGRTIDKSQMDAGFSALANGALASLPLGAMMRPGGTFLGKTLQTAGAAAFQNAATQALQEGYDSGVIGEHMTLGEAAQRVIDAGLVGGVTGALMGAGEHGVERLGARRAPPPDEITPAGQAAADLGANIEINGRQVAAAPTTEAVAGDIMAAGDIDQAIQTAQSAVTRPPLDVDAMGAEAKRQGAEGLAPAEDTLSAAEIPDADQDLAQTAAPASALDDGGYQEVARPSGPAPLEPAYSDAKTRAETYSRWLDDLDAKRRQDAAASPMANYLRRAEASILGKVNGVEDRLTNAGAARLADVRGALDELLNPAGDSPDMARVRESMVAEHQKMADAAAPPPILREVQAQADAIGEPVSHDEAQQIASEIGAHDIDPETALAEHIERKAIRGLYSDDEGSAASPAPTEPVTGRPGETDLTIGNRVPGQEPVPVEEGGARPIGEPTPENPSQARQLEPATFTTAKGSTYEVHEDGTTTRNKAARPEHPGEEGPQPRSEATFYVTPERADELGLIQTHGGQPMAIAERADGTVGVKYTAGPGAGKFERRTVGPVSREPAPGLIPVETWKDGTRVHFGNEITEVNTPKPKAGTMALRANQDGARYGETPSLEQAPAVEQQEIPRPRALALKGIEGTGEEKSRSVSPGQTYLVGEEAPQIEAAARLVEKDPAAAEEIAMRRKQPPPGVHPEFVFMALENKATREGNTDLIARLNQSRISEEATTMGQRVAAYRNRDPLSAVAHVQAVQNARTAAAEATHGDVVKAKAKALEEVTQEVQQAKKTAASTRPRQSWESFIDSLTCVGE